MTFKQLETRIDRNVAKIVKQTAQEFNADIISAWAVDTGFSKSQWKLDRIDRLTWTVSNHVSYTPILFLGRIGNRGSEQLPNGGYPILDANILKMKRKLRKDVL